VLPLREVPPRQARHAPRVASKSARRGVGPGRPPLRLRLSVVASGQHPDLPARSTLRRWVRMALGRDAQICLVFANGPVGRRLNRQFRARNYPTNVLTFAYQTQPRVVAEIVLCMPVVRREAREQGKTLRQHLAHMIVHGVLHAQGYDHVKAGESQRMQLLERLLLARLRIPDPYA
jgi:probable rRNA maturation factor